MPMTAGFLREEPMKSLRECAVLGAPTIERPEFRQVTA
jgi:hypothetical protein